MYLSCLDLDPDPTNRRAHLWIANPYRVHQRLSLAFPEPGRVLYRLEDRPSLRLLVQSPAEPDWQAAFANFPVLAGPPRCKPFEPAVTSGMRLRFRVRANPTVCRAGKRHGLFREQDQIAWLARKGEAGGFLPLATRVRGGTTQISRKGLQYAPAVQTHLAVEFEGLLVVRDADRFAESLARGIGPAKAYGFGLLCIAPAG